MTQRILILSTFIAAGAFAQEAAPAKAAVQQRVAAIKQSMAENQAKLKTYAWTETTEVLRKDEVKKRDQKDCHYGPDGKVVKTPIGEAPQQAKKKGLKGKIIENKVEDIKEYLDRAASLIRRYAPPNPQDMEAALKAGKATLNPTSGMLTFNDYVKPGDKVTLAFDVATKKLRSFNVDTWLDEPKDAVTLKTSFNSLPDGTNFLEQSLFDATAKEIKIRTTNSGHHKAGSYSIDRVKAALSRSRHPARDITGDAQGGVSAPNRAASCRYCATVNARHGAASRAGGR